MVLVVKRSASAEAILDAARRLIVYSGGPDRLSLSAVAAEAGVSRPTLYRWFPTREHLLAAITEDEEERFDRGLTEVLHGARTPADRLDAALDYLVSFLDDHLGADAVSVDPGFALRSLAASLPRQVETWVRLLGDALSRVPAVRSGELSVEQAAELFLRLAESHYLVPHPDPPTLLRSMRSMAGLRPRLRHRAAG